MLTKRFNATVVALFLCSVAWLSSGASQASAGLNNQLVAHPSPYLALHGQDPVHWQAWGPDVMQAAQASGRPIFISSGYFSCHWCHVMQRESFQNAAIARLLNEQFIPVKIDRELRPALDDYLIQFVEQTTGVAGWPLNVFLTPEGYPMLGLTYAPPDNFQTILQRIVDTWQAQAPRATQLAKELVDFNRQAQLQADAPLNQVDRVLLQSLPTKLVEQALGAADSFEGGFGDQSRFPMAPQLLALLEIQRTANKPALNDFLRLTLDQMQNLGLRDHLNGGFYRYTVDPGWQEPHFEKMLYTQALLARVYLQAAQVFSDLGYLQTARATLDYVMQAMRANSTGYLSSYSAIDDQDVEGGGYLWSKAELESLLPADQLAVLAARWQMTPAPRFEAGYLPLQARSWQVVAEQVGISATEAEQLAEQAFTKLRAVGKVQTVPRDDKGLTGWNALLLSTLSQAAMLLGDETYRDAACQLRDELVNQAWDGQRLLRVMNRSESGNRQSLLGRAGLEDYAYLAMALRDYSQLQDSAEDLVLARQLADKAWQLFYQDGYWQSGDEKLLPGMLGTRQLGDGALPAADAVLMQVSLSVQDPGLFSRANQAAENMLRGLLDSPFDHATHLAWLAQYLKLNRQQAGPGAG